VKFSLHARSLPGRIAAGAFILHAGLEKWSGDETRAAGVHGMAAGAYPVFNEVPAPIFLKTLAAAEIATGALLLSPFASDAAAGAALTAFSGGLLGMYWRTETLRKPGSVWPTQAGTAVSKDVWMLGIGLGLMLDSLTSWRRKKS
jgi:hypothetical protein